MSSGAFALYLDHEAGGGPNTPIRRVIPLPISDGAGIRFTHRQLSLAYDDFGGGPATLPVTVRLITANGTVTSTTPMTIHVGCQFVQHVQDNDCLASIEVAAGIRPALTALVEYSS
jgi:hypothetical protein